MGDAGLLQILHRADHLGVVQGGKAERVIDGLHKGRRIVREGGRLFLIEARDDPVAVQAFGIGGGDIDEEAVPVGDPDLLSAGAGGFHLVQLFSFESGELRFRVHQGGPGDLPEPGQGDGLEGDLQGRSDLPGCFILPHRRPLTIVEVQGQLEAVPFL